MARQTRLMMGMPITIDIPGAGSDRALTPIFDLFDEVDARFSPYRDDSEVSAINAGRLSTAQASPEMAEILEIAAQMKTESGGYFDIRHPDGHLDPSGVVKGWAIQRAAQRILGEGFADFYVDAGGDIQTGGTDADGQDWTIGIRNPFDQDQIVKAIAPRGHGVATSGSYIRGDHIYDPHSPGQVIKAIVSLTVIGPDVLKADLHATAAFAMGAGGIQFIDAVPGLEGYVIHADRTAQQTEGFKEFVIT